ncbi:phytoene/squalene synthase family protein [Pedobacter sp. MC2016-15]|uniref:phytoene/squalene synthase family protein n=1 Tax=Pedobacter sp. MC2016-15 TaxID=2994473 RepID=UPI00224566BB|nr:phytoene/squalene synthase family protein [Pedobacter sp. MC2016-15]MCX2480661.1 phytoene/squalene synthase family protein [Pedobacter sp. MC2016-15]
MKELFDQISIASSTIVTKTYSTSFSLGIRCLNKKFHNAIYSIYGFVRLADEIVDSFHGYDKQELLADFKTGTYRAIEQGISLNPILNSFQQVVNDYGIERELTDCFLASMEMDLDQTAHCEDSYETYILGSAEVVGLMCLRVFTENNRELYQQLKPAAMKLGAAFQKVNFLRDLKNDYEVLGRVYFPQVDLSVFSEKEKKEIEQDIEADFVAALAGIKELPRSSRFGVYVAYIYYKSLFNKIKSVSSVNVMSERIRIPNAKKLGLLAGSYVKHSFGMI